MHKYAVKAAMHPEKLPVAGSVGGRLYTVKYIAHKCMPIKVSI